MVGGKGNVLGGIVKETRRKARDCKKTQVTSSPVGATKRRVKQYDETDYRNVNRKKANNGIKIIHRQQKKRKKHLCGGRGTTLTRGRGALGERGDATVGLVRGGNRQL